jgi:hypothetical protein
MPRYEFPYLQHFLVPTPAFPNGHPVNRAIVGARLRKGELNSTPFFGIVDTGADYCMFPSELLVELGIDRSTLPTTTATGFAHDNDVRFAYVDLEVPPLGVHTIYAGFADNLNGKEYGMLGHMGFLNRFTLRFDPRNLKFELED